ncbi:MAG: hypothetical protein ACKO26_19765, partial [Planctomycetota bacterium]
GILVLNGPPSLSPEAATAFSAFPGKLVPKGITELHTGTAAALASHKEALQLRAGWLSGLPEEARRGGSKPLSRSSPNGIK